MPPVVAVEAIQASAQLTQSAPQSDAHRPHGHIRATCDVPRRKIFEVAQEQRETVGLAQIENRFDELAVHLGARDHLRRRERRAAPRPRVLVAAPTALSAEEHPGGVARNPAQPRPQPPLRSGRAAESGAPGLLNDVIDLILPYQAARNAAYELGMRQQRLQIGRHVGLHDSTIEMPAAEKAGQKKPARRPLLPILFIPPAPWLTVTPEALAPHRAGEDPAKTQHRACGERRNRQRADRGESFNNSAPNCATDGTARLLGAIAWGS